MMFDLDTIQFAILVITSLIVVVIWGVVNLLTSPNADRFPSGWALLKRPHRQSGHHARHRAHLHHP